MTHPYRHQPDRAFWHRSVAGRPWPDVEFESERRPLVRPDTRIVTAGSCFAANLLRWMPRLGLEPFFTELAPEWFTPAEATVHHYGEFGARYGNIYTVRQLRQLVEEALGHRPMAEEFQTHDGRVYDLLRPHVRPGGFVSEHEARLDRAFHLRCVERLLRESDVFVFTLGLTEAWVHRERGTVYPVCPGTAAGTYDPQCHVPVNHDYPSIIEDLTWVVDTMAEANPALQWILTVSPVPLVATHTEHSVVVATTYSKSVLRAACGAVEQARAQVSYFPSYEIIASAQSFGQYLASDLREVTELGIAHVMSVFDRVYVEHTGTARAEVRTAAPFTAVERALSAECDELLNDFTAET